MKINEWSQTCESCTDSNSATGRSRSKSIDGSQPHVIETRCCIQVFQHKPPSWAWNTPHHNRNYMYHHTILHHFYSRNLPSHYLLLWWLEWYSQSLAGKFAILKSWDFWIVSHSKWQVPGSQSGRQIWIQTNTCKTYWLPRTQLVNAIRLTL